jgi:cell wall assembly regulator SMI1
MYTNNHRFLGGFMENLFDKCAKKIDLSEIKAIEKDLNIIFPKDFTEHYLLYNGGVPVNCHYYIEDNDIDTSVSLFYPLKNHIETIEINTIEERYLQFIEKGILPKNFVPFASDWGGNQFCIDIKDSGTVYLVYMDLGNPLEAEDAIIKIANNFNNFLEKLEEEEDDDI